MRNEMKWWGKLEPEYWDELEPEYWGELEPEYCGEPAEHVLGHWRLLNLPDHQSLPLK